MKHWRYAWPLPLALVAVGAGHIAASISREAFWAVHFQAEIAVVIAFLAAGLYSSRALSDKNYQAPVWVTRCNAVLVGVVVLSMAFAAWRAM